MTFQDRNICVAPERGEPPGAARTAMQRPSVERRNEAGARFARNPKGRGLLRYGFVEGLARRAKLRASPSSCPQHKMSAAQLLLSWKVMV